MKDLWPLRAYVDLFSGPGLCKNRETGVEFRGSPLAALQYKNPFTHLFFNDIRRDFVEALSNRQKQLRPQANVKFFNLDCNQAAREIAKHVPPRALTLAFIDPWNYELTFDGLALFGREACD